MFTPGAPRSGSFTRVPEMTTSPAGALRLLLAGALLLLALSAVPATGAVSGAHLIDGPAAAIDDIGGVAMAPDGTGGVVYRKVDDDGRMHIFAASFRGGVWTAPQRVDVGPTQRFESSWPAIGAGNGGRLVVVWAQDFGAVDRLFSATLQPGAQRFEAPVPVDLNIGDSTLGTWPQVSMAAGGQALLSYRVVTNPQPGNVPPGNVLGEIRLARLGGQLWTSFGVPVNRNQAAGQPAPTALNGPRVGVDQNGSGVVAWTELDDQFVSRVYMRRVFGATVGIARQVTPGELDGQNTRGSDAFALDVGRNGEAALAWRQQATDTGMPPRVYLAQLADQFAADATAFGLPRLADGAAEYGHSGVMAPSVSVSGSDALVGLALPNAAVGLDADEATVAAPERLDRGEAAAAPLTQVALSTDGNAVLAWATGTERRGTVALRERRDDGSGTERPLTGPAGGGVDAIHMDGSGVGDALIAFTQGTAAGRQVVVGAVDSAPQTFAVQAPLDWVRSATVGLAWDPAVHAIGKVRYALVVDDEEVARDLRSTDFELALRRHGIRDGRRTVAVVATDDAGQETSSIPAVLKVDRGKPRVRITRRGRRITVRVTDARSGVNAGATSIRIGAGKARTGRSRRSVTVRRAGRVLVSVRTRDRAGNRTTVKRRVTVR